MLRMTDDLPIEERLLTYRECAKRVGISEATMRRKVKELRIPHVAMGHQIVRFHYPTVLKYIQETKAAE